MQKRIKKSSEFHNLPVEIIEHILSYVNREELMNVRYFFPKKHTKSEMVDSQTRYSGVIDGHRFYLLSHTPYNRKNVCQYPRCLLNVQNHFGFEEFASYMENSSITKYFTNNHQVHIRVSVSEYMNFSRKRKGEKRNNYDFLSKLKVPTRFPPGNWVIDFEFSNHFKDLGYYEESDTESWKHGNSILRATMVSLMLIEKFKACENPPEVRMVSIPLDAYRDVIGLLTNVKQVDPSTYIPDNIYFAVIAKDESLPVEDERICGYVHIENGVEHAANIAIPFSNGLFKSGPDVFTYLEQKDTTIEEGEKIDFDPAQKHDIYPRKYLKVRHSIEDDVTSLGAENVFVLQISDFHVFNTMDETYKNDVSLLITDEYEQRHTIREFNKVEKIPKCVKRISIEIYDSSLRIKKFIFKLLKKYPTATILVDNNTENDDDISMTIDIVLRN